MMRIGSCRAVASPCSRLPAAAHAQGVTNPAHHPAPVTVTIDGQTYHDGLDTLPGYDDEACTPIPNVQYDFASDQIQYYGSDGDAAQDRAWTEWSRISSYDDLEGAAASRTPTPPRRRRDRQATPTAEHAPTPVEQRARRARPRRPARRRRARHHQHHGQEHRPRKSRRPPRARRPRASTTELLDQAAPPRRAPRPRAPSSAEHDVEHVEALVLVVRRAERHVERPRGTAPRRRRRDRRPGRRRRAGGDRGHDCSRGRARPPARRARATPGTGRCRRHRHGREPTTKFKLASQHLGAARRRGRHPPRRRRDPGGVLRPRRLRPRSAASPAPGLVIASCDNSA